jgi:two-component system phosphate regulon response regulator PhoB
VAKATILVVEDDPDIQELLVYNLGKEGYTVITADNGEKALRLAPTVNADLILLDIMLPGMDGTDVLRELRKDARTAEIPVIMTTAKSEDSDIIAGLELGADDYITKPFSPRVLVARIRNLLRRNAGPAPLSFPREGILEIGELRLDVARHVVTVEGRAIDLSATEFAILEFLMRNPGWVFSRSQIIDAVKGKDYPVTERSVDVQVLGLRKKLGDPGEHIQTVRGVGYRFQEGEL